MRLSILDQSPVISGHSACRAIQETLALARRAEIEAMAAGYGADEVMVLTITGDYASRTRSYERLIGAF